jgi:uncharacterized protein (TIGR02145 family)
MKHIITQKASKIIAGVCLLVASISIMQCTKDIAGTVDDTDTGISAMLYNPDGTAAVGAVVKVFEAADTSKKALKTVITDKNGRYTANGLSAGRYNVYAEKGSLVAFQDSVAVLDDTALVNDDTLETARKVTIIVGMQPNDDPRTVTVQILGSEIFFQNLDNRHGYCTFDKMAQGTYHLRLETTLEGYTTTYPTITITANSPDTLKDTIKMVYTGIPIVKGITATYDTLDGLVKLRWNKTDYENLQKYVIYRDDANALTLSTTPIGLATDTFFVDTVFKLTNSNSTFSDTTVYNYEYRVAIRNNSQVIGMTYKNVAVVAASPTLVKTIFYSNVRHMGLNASTDSASVNDTLQYTITATNPTRKLKQVIWTNLQSGIQIRSKNIDSGSLTISDTTKYVWTTLGTKGIECKVIDDAGTIWKNTFSTAIVLDKSIIELTTTTPSVDTNDTIKLHIMSGDKFGKIIKCEWWFSNTNTWKVDPLADTNIIAPSTMQALTCSLKVTDDDGNVSYDAIQVLVGYLVKDFEGNVYPTTIIGNQVWTTVNLRSTKYNDGSAIPLITDSTAWTNLSTGAYCFFGNSTNNTENEKYGALYNWYAVNIGKLAPAGWRVPSDEDWTILTEYVGGESIAGKKLKVSDWNGLDTRSVNEYNFSALPAGIRLSDNGNFQDQTSLSCWWSTTENNLSYAYSRGLMYYSDDLYRGIESSKKLGNSIRLVRDLN